MEVALADHRQRVLDVERRQRFAVLARERREQDEPPQSRSQAGKPGLQAKLDWPVLSFRLGPLRLALFRTVRVPSGRAAFDSHGTPRVFPGFRE